MDGHISGQTPVNHSKPVSSNLLNWVHLSSIHPVSVQEGWSQLRVQLVLQAQPFPIFCTGANGATMDVCSRQDKTR